MKGDVTICSAYNAVDALHQKSTLLLLNRAVKYIPNSVFRRTVLCTKNWKQEQNATGAPIFLFFLPGGGGGLAPHSSRTPIPLTELEASFLNAVKDSTEAQFVCERKVLNLSYAVPTS
jgi:hypothetical protein